VNSDTANQSAVNPDTANPSIVNPEACSTVEDTV